LLFHMQTPAAQQAGAALNLAEAPKQVQQAGLHHAQLQVGVADAALQAGDQQAAQFAQIAGGFRQVLEVDQLQAGQQFADLGLGQLILADLGTQAADVAELVVDAAPQHADVVAQTLAEAVDVLAQVGQVGIGGNVVALVTRLGVVGGQGAEGG